MAFSAVSKQALLDRVPGLAIVDTLGASEAMITRSTATRDDPSMPTTFAAKANVRVLTDDGRDVVPGSGEDGVLTVAGRLPLGYHHDPDATARMFREVDGVRYATPGDRARVLVDGRIELLGRGSACINTGGEKVYPEEVEQVLRAASRGGRRRRRRRARRSAGARWSLRWSSSSPDTMLDTATLDGTSAVRPCRSLAGYKVPKRFLVRRGAAAHRRRQARLPAPAGAGGRIVNADDTGAIESPRWHSGRRPATAMPKRSSTASSVSRTPSSLPRRC